MSQQVYDAIEKLSGAVQQLEGVRLAQASTVGRLSAEVASLEQEIVLLTHCATAFDQLLKAVSSESVEAIERLVTFGLRSVFEDLSLTFKILIEQKRGGQWMEARLDDNGVEAPILDAFGGGPAAVVAFLLRLLVCRRLGLAPVILLDEPFSFVSEQYVENVGKLLRELAEKAGVTILMVTHERGFLSHAHHAYEIVETSHGSTFQPTQP